MGVARFHSLSASVWGLERSSRIRTQGCRVLKHLALEFWPVTPQYCMQQQQCFWILLRKVRSTKRRWLLQCHFQLIAFQALPIQCQHFYSSKVAGYVIVSFQPPRVKKRFFCDILLSVQSRPISWNMFRQTYGTASCGQSHTYVHTYIHIHTY